MIGYRWKRIFGAALVASVLVLSGCGGGGGGSTGGAINGKVVDGYIKDAHVFADKNKNEQEDAGEANTTTDANGDFSFQAGVVEVGDFIYAYGGVDLATDLPFKGRLSAVYDGTAYIVSPQTSMMAALVKNGKSIEEAKKRVAQALGIDESKVMADPMKDADAFFASQQIVAAAQIMGIAAAGDVNETVFEKAIEALAENDFNLSAAAQAFTNEVNASVDHEKVAAAAENVKDFIGQLKEEVNGTVSDLSSYQVVASSVAEQVAEQVKNDENVTVPDVNDTKAVLEAVECLTFEKIKGENGSENSVTKDLNLSAKSQCEVGGATITWDVEPADVIDTTTGALDIVYSNTNVVLKANIKKGKANAVKRFNLFVPRNGNRPPVANDDNVTTLEDTPVTFDPVANDTDPDGDALTLAEVADPAHGTVAKNGNVVVYTPDMNYNGTDTFSYKIRDGWGGESNGTIHITVTSVNDAPILYPPAPVTINEDREPVQVELNATDPDTDPANLTYSVVVVPANIVDVNISGNVVTITPLPNMNGTVTVTATVSDGENNDTKTFTVTVLNVSDPAVIGGTTTGSVTEDRTTMATGKLNVTDPDPGEDHFIAETNTTDYGTFEIGEDGSWQFTLDNTSDAVQSLAQGETKQLFFPVHSADGTPVQVTITISGINDTPIAEDIQKVAFIGSTVTIDLSQYVHDIDNDQLEARIVNGGAMIDGMTVTYEAPNQAGLYEIEYSVSDGMAEANGTITIQVSDGEAVSMSTIEGQTMSEVDIEDEDDTEYNIFDFQNSVAKIRQQHFVKDDGTWVRFDLLIEEGSYQIDADSNTTALHIQEGNFTISNLRRMDLDGTSINIPIDELNVTVDFGANQYLYRMDFRIDSGVARLEEPFTDYQPWSQDRPKLQYDSLEEFMQDFSINMQNHWFEEWDEETQKGISYAFDSNGSGAVAGKLISTDDNSTEVGTWTKAQGVVWVKLDGEDGCWRDAYGIVDGVLFEGEMPENGCTETLALYGANATQAIEGALPVSRGDAIQVPESVHHVDPAEVNNKQIDIHILEKDLNATIKIYADGNYTQTMSNGVKFSGAWSIDANGSIHFTRGDEEYVKTFFGPVGAGTYGTHHPVNTDDVSVFKIINVGDINAGGGSGDTVTLILKGADWAAYSYKDGEWQAVDFDALDADKTFTFKADANNRYGVALHCADADSPVDIVQATTDEYSTIDMCGEGTCVRHNVSGTISGISGNMVTVAMHSSSDSNVTLGNTYDYKLENVAEGTWDLVVEDLDMTSYKVKKYGIKRDIEVTADLTDVDLDLSSEGIDPVEHNFTVTGGTGVASFLTKNGSALGLIGMSNDDTGFHAWSALASGTIEGDIYSFLAMTENNETNQTRLLLETKDATSFAEDVSLDPTVINEFNATMDWPNRSIGLNYTKSDSSPELSAYMSSIEQDDSGAERMIWITKAWLDTASTYELPQLSGLGHWNSSWDFDGNNSIIWRIHALMLDMRLGEAMEKMSDAENEESGTPYFMGADITVHIAEKHGEIEQ
ncbi:Ig-like domain-containing protein [Hydrogenimonas sp.]